MQYARMIDDEAGVHRSGEAVRPVPTATGVRTRDELAVSSEAKALESANRVPALGTVDVRPAARRSDDGIHALRAPAVATRGGAA